MPKLDLSSLPVRTGSGYPPEFAAAVAGRSSLRLADAGGLTQFGANLITLLPGAWASQRHWHENEDEFVLIVSGSLVMIEDEGETPMRAGDCATHKAGVANGHHLVNRSEKPATFLVIGTRASSEIAHYPDIDLLATRIGTAQAFTRKDGSSF
jgi:uncharacterized cupin superfamily protein